LIIQRKTPLTPALSPRERELKTKSWEVWLRMRTLFSNELILRNKVV